MAKGRTPKPHALRVIEGNPGKRPFEKALPTPPAVEAEDLVCPPEVADDDYARGAWAAIGPELKRLGLLTKVDLPQFAICCIAYAEARHALDDVREAKSREYETHGRQGTMIRTRPAFARLTESIRLFNTLAGSFGLTPVDRLRLEGVAQGDLFGWDKPNGPRGA